MGDIHMPQIGGELRQFTPNIEAGAIPFDQLPRSKAVPKILKPGPPAAAVAFRRRAYSNSSGNPGECAAGRIALQSFAALGNQKRLTPTARTELIALLAIVRKGRTSRVCHGDETGFSEFALPNRQDSAVEINVRLIQGKSLPWAEACSREKPDESCVGQRP